MPKHIIEFNLPEEQDELETTMKARDYSLALWDLDQKLRGMYKHGSKPGEEWAEDARKLLWEILDEYSIKL